MNNLESDTWEKGQGRKPSEQKKDELDRSNDEAKASLRLLVRSIVLEMIAISEQHNITNKEVTNDDGKYTLTITSELDVSTGRNSAIFELEYKPSEAEQKTKERVKYVIQGNILKATSSDFDGILTYEDRVNKKTPDISDIWDVIRNEIKKNKK